MDPKVAILLEQDLKKDISLRDSVPQSKNYGVLNSTYLTPVTNFISLPMNDTRGLFMYYRRMIHILQEAKSHRGISKDSLPSTCPRWLEELVE